MLQKLKSAKRIFKSEGVAGLVAVYPRRFRHWIESHDLLWGRVVELRGNRVRLDGLEFLVDVPYLTTRDKAQYLFDRYERPERICVRQFLDPELPVVELGGNIGVVSCVVNKKLTRPQDHVVIEANPSLIPFLERNREHNACKFTVLNCALAYGSDDVTFNLSSNILGSSVQRKGEKSVTVPAMTLARILDDYRFRTCTLICDIEGGELDLVENELQTVSERVSTIIVETHSKFTGQAAVDNMLDRFCGAGFEIKFNRWSSVVMQNTLTQ